MHVANSDAARQRHSSFFVETFLLPSVTRRALPEPDAERRSNPDPVRGAPRPVRVTNRTPTYGAPGSREPSGVVFVWFQTWRPRRWRAIEKATSRVASTNLRLPSAGQIRLVTFKYTRAPPAYAHRPNQNFVFRRSHNESAELSATSNPEIEVTGLSVP